MGTAQHRRGSPPHACEHPRHVRSWLSVKMSVRRDPTHPLRAGLTQSLLLRCLRAKPASLTIHRPEKKNLSPLGSMLGPYAEPGGRLVSGVSVQSRTPSGRRWDVLFSNSPPPDSAGLRTGRRVIKLLALRCFQMMKHRAICQGPMRPFVLKDDCTPSDGVCVRVNYACFASERFCFFKPYPDVESYCCQNHQK